MISGIGVTINMRMCPKIPILTILLLLAATTAEAGVFVVDEGRVVVSDAASITFGWELQSDSNSEFRGEHGLDWSIFSDCTKVDSNYNATVVSTPSWLAIVENYALLLHSERNAIGRRFRLLRPV